MFVDPQNWDFCLTEPYYQSGGMYSSPSVEIFKVLDIDVASQLRQ